MDKPTPKKKAASPKKTVKKAVTKKAVKAKAPVKKASVKKAVSKKAVKTISYQQRYQMIAEAAYLLAEQQNFRADSELDNWLAAEAQIDGWIKKDKIKLTE